MGRRTRRIEGASQSAARDSRRRRRQITRVTSGFWLLASIGVVGFASWSLVADPIATADRGRRDALLEVVFVTRASVSSRNRSVGNCHRGAGTEATGPCGCRRLGWDWHPEQP